MNQLPICYYCQKQISGKPFIPVNCEQPFHWKCFINKINNEDNESRYVEEYEVEKVEANK